MESAETVRDSSGCCTTRTSRTFHISIDTVKNRRARGCPAVRESRRAAHYDDRRPATLDREAGGCHKLMPDSAAQSHHGKWVKARYVAEREIIAARYADWEIIGPPEIRDVDPQPGYFRPWRPRPKSRVISCSKRYESCTRTAGVYLRCRCL
jgi:hypothetical protein